jgi:hypothetical protein
VKVDVDLIGWLRALGQRWIGVPMMAPPELGLEKGMLLPSVQAHELLRAVEEYKSIALQSQAIEVEKILCAAMGRQWSATGISVHSLIEEVKEKYDHIKDMADDYRFEHF